MRPCRSLRRIAGLPGGPYGPALTMIDETPLFRYNASKRKREDTRHGIGEQIGHHHLGGACQRRGAAQQGKGSGAV